MRFSLFYLLFQYMFYINIILSFISFLVCFYVNFLGRLFPLKATRRNFLRQAALLKVKNIVGKFIL